MQPVLVINKPVEITKRRYPRRLPLTQPRSVGMKVPLQGHRSYHQPCALPTRMAIASRIQQPIQPVQQPVYPVGCASRSRTIISSSEVLSPLAQFQHHLLGCPAHLFIGPMLQPSQSLRKAAFGLGLIGLPHSGQHPLTQLASTARSDFQRRMQVTQDQTDMREQQQPRFASRFPSIRANGTRLPISKNFPRFVSEFAIAFKQTFGIIFLGNRHAQKTAAACRSRHRDFPAFDPGNLFISDQISRHRRTGFNSRPDHIATTQAEPGAIPEHMVAAKYISQSLKRYAPLPEVKGLLNVVGACRQVRQDERGANGEDLFAGLEFDATQAELKLSRVIRVVKSEALTDRVRKEFGVEDKLLSQVLTKQRRVIGTTAIEGFSVERQADMLIGHGWSSSSPSEFVCATNSMGQLRWPSYLFMEFSKSNHKFR